MKNLLQKLIDFLNILGEHPTILDDLVSGQLAKDIQELLHPDEAE